jgi:hypothetical protein
MMESCYLMQTVGIRKRQRTSTLNESKGLLILVVFHLLRDLQISDYLRNVSCRQIPYICCDICI